MSSRTPGPSAALEGVRSAAATVRRAVRRRRHGPWHAVVEQFRRDGLSGWVEVPHGAPPVRVALFVNGTEVAQTWASDPTARTATGEVRGFSLGLRDLWRFTSRAHRLSVRVDGVRLPIAGHGLWVRPAEDGPRPLGALRKALAAGGEFTADGSLQRPATAGPTGQERVLALYERVRTVLARELGHDVFLAHRSLLAVLRDDAPLAPDRALDAAYVSGHTVPAEVARELQQIAFLLVEHGFDVEGGRAALHLHDPDDPAVGVDLYHLFFDDAGTMRHPSGAAGAAEVTRGDWQGVRELDVGGGRAHVPVCAERLLEALYGGGWRRLAPSLPSASDEPRRAVGEALLLPAQREEVYWANFYARNDFGSGSTFHDAVEGTPGVPRTVIDLGCGQGRDSFAFATAGRTVMGIDRSHVGIRHAAAKAESVGLSDRLSFAACDVSDASALTAVLDQVRQRADGGPVLFYARFFLHSVPEDVQEALLSIVASSARPGDWFAAEFRTDKDAAGKKVYTKHYRRFQNGPAFGRRLGDVFGWEVVQEQEGTGLSPYQDEDPELYRVLARRP